jgi:plastocyanin
MTTRTQLTLTLASLALALAPTGALAYYDYSSSAYPDYSTYPAYYQQQVNPTYYQQGYMYPTSPYVSPVYSYPGYQSQIYNDYYNPGYDSYNQYYDKYYRRSYHYDADVLPRYTNPTTDLPSYYEEYTTPPPVQPVTTNRRYRAATPKYYPPAVTVTMYNGGFHPGTLTVKVGTMITWLNLSDDDYALRGDNFDFHTVTLDEGEEASYSFAEVGTFYYHDMRHPGIRGTVKVVRN